MTNPETHAFRCAIDLVSNFHKVVSQHDECLTYIKQLKETDPESCKCVEALERTCIQLYQYTQNIWAGSVKENADINTIITGLGTISTNYMFILNSHLLPLTNGTSKRHDSSPIDRRTEERQELQRELLSITPQIGDSCSTRLP